MLIMGVYHFIFFSMRKKDKSLLWFGLFCLIAAMRTAVVEYFIERSFQQTVQIFSSTKQTPEFLAELKNWIKANPDLRNTCGMS